MKMSFKQKIAKATGNNRNLNTKVLRFKSSWDEVSGILDKAMKKKKKK